MLSIDDILAQFDSVAGESEFPDLDNGYYFPIDVAMHLFHDTKRWALVVELVGYNPQANNVYDAIHAFGNCLLIEKPGLADLVPRIDNVPSLEHPNNPEVYRGDVPISVRDQPLSVQAIAGEPLQVTFRRIIPQYRKMLFAQSSELLSIIPSDVSLLLKLDEWYQPPLFNALPSSTETYRMIANVLATGEKARYQPTQRPNTHWSHWPEAGTL